MSSNAMTIVVSQEDSFVMATQMIARIMKMRVKSAVVLILEI